MYLLLRVKIQNGKMTFLSQSLLKWKLNNNMKKSVLPVHSKQKKLKRKKQEKMTRRYLNYLSSLLVCLETPSRNIQTDCSNQRRVHKSLTRTVFFPCTESRYLSVSKNLVPRQLRAEMLQKIQCPTLAAHSEEQVMYGLIRSSYFWSHMAQTLNYRSRT